VRWYPLGTPPRRHNRVTPLIDGQAYFSALQEALAHAEHYVYISGWCLTPDIPLAREDRPALQATQLLTLLAAAAARVPVRVLLWSGAGLLFQPTRQTMKAVQTQIQTQGHGDLICRLDNTARFSHCHHQKAVVIDGRVAFVGGIDLTTFGGDRWDTPRHPLRLGLNWHDVMLQIEGEAVADVERNFRERWRAVAGPAPLPHHAPVWERGWTMPVQILRTIPRRTYAFARHGEFGIRHAYRHALRQARRLIYLENQYLWSPEIRDILRAALETPPAAAFRILIVLPAAAEDGEADNDKHVDELLAADKGRGILSVYSTYTSGVAGGEHPFTYKPIYVHAKVAIVDDEWLTVGSANLNDRSLYTDSEINAAVRDAGLARRLRADLWAEHLGMAPAEVAAADPIALIDGVWRTRATANAAIIAQGDRPLPNAVHLYHVHHKPGAVALAETEALLFDL